MGRRNPGHSMHGKGVSKRWDRWFSLAVRQRDSWTCRNCQAHIPRERGTDMCRIECAHIHGRDSKSVRWDPRNAVALCSTCHNYFTRHPIYWGQFCTELLGQDHMDDLNRRHNTILKVNDDLLSAISDHYRIAYNTMVESGQNDLQAWEGLDHEDEPERIRQPHPRIGPGVQRERGASGDG